MKKAILMITVVAAVGFTSCKKDYTCRCVDGNDVIEVELNGVKEGDAEDACADAETTYNLGGINSYTCTLQEN